MKKSGYDKVQVKELLLQMMETELGGEQIYRTALTCALNKDLKEEWQGYLDETLRHQNIVNSLCESMSINPKEKTPSRAVVRHIGESLVTAMVMAKKSGDPVAAQLVACECVVLAETKDHSNWELLGKVAEAATGDTAKVLKNAYESVQDEEAHHLYHTMGWCRELWLDSLGIPAVLPPPEEVKKVQTPIGASRAEQQRDKML